MKFSLNLFDQLEAKGHFVIVTVIEVSGSAPREVGARMVVTENTESGSIGGGNLEFQAIKSARAILSDSTEFVRKTEFHGLGVTLKQCCGGAVQLMFEAFTEEDVKQLVDDVSVEHGQRPKFLISCVSDQLKTRAVTRRSDVDNLPTEVWDAAQGLLANSCESSLLVTSDAKQWFVTLLNENPTKVVLFGAGHVGKALVNILQELPFQVDWVDQREDIFPAHLPENTLSYSPDDLTGFIDKQSDDVFFVVMTHDHGLDYELCRQILKKRKFGWLGLIGSSLKKKRFEQRLIKDGVDSFTLQRLVCPIGMSSVRGKFPAVIAVSTAAQLLEVRNKLIFSKEADDTVLKTGVKH